VANKIIVSTYEKLEKYLGLYVDKKADLMILQSKEGLGKSSLVDLFIKDKPTILFTVQATPLRNYIELFKNKDKEPYIVYRDIDYLLKSDIQVSLFKQLCETKPIKEIRYYSTSKIMEGIPSSFKLKSSVLVETNYWSTSNPNVRAVADRGFWLYFKPSVEEVLNKMQEIVRNCKDYLNLKQRSEVFEFIKEHAKGTSLSLRDLIRGFQLYSYSLVNKSFDWKSELGALIEVPETHRIVLDLLKSKKKASVQAKEFSKRTGCSERKYWRLKKALTE